MAVGPYAYPGGGGNTFVKDHSATGNLVVSFSRNPNKFPLVKYVQYREVKKEAGYYLRINIEEAGRLVGGTLDEYVWPDGHPRPRRNAGTEQFRYEDYRTQRYDYDFTLGYKATEQADWPVKELHSQFNSQKAMTARTKSVVATIETEANWDATHVSNAADISGNSGSWELSTTQRQDLKRSINHALLTIKKDVLNGGIEKSDFHLVMNPTTASRIGECQEIVDYVKGSPVAWGQVRGDNPGLYAEYGLPNQLYGIPIVVEDTVYVSTIRGHASVQKSFVMTDGNAFLMARPGGIVSAAGSGPSFSTAMVFLYEEMTVETIDDKDNRRTEGHVVDDFDAVMTAPVTGFFFKNVIE